MEALRRYCASPGCPARVVRGFCARHKAATAKQFDHARGSRQSRGYGAAWDRFRTRTFPALLEERGVLPACGARLSGVPSPHSECVALGRVELQGLHLDHDPPLLPHERRDESAVCDPDRVGYLCIRCHNRKTKAERARVW